MKSHQSAKSHSARRKCKQTVAIKKTTSALSKIRLSLKGKRQAGAFPGLEKGF